MKIKLLNYISYFDDDFRVIVVEGDYLYDGNDGESVVDVSGILEIWDFNDFFKFMDEIE
ncbi:hypothetical protein [Clostridioides difficile]|uniref:hypothetical protein n=1 Tax=Clostridioides difficile TaxID=1496 RepID=UPI0021C72061|nr:hypothetical protein [Clostridioides difficile]UUV16718.1 hypothetical protein NQ183_19820 [Clostridioides difficile]